MTASSQDNPVRPAQSGIFLGEALVALLIGVFLSAGVAYLFFAARHNHQSDEAFVRLQANGRAALEAIARDVRMAGYAGCTRLENLAGPPVLGPDHISFSPADVITGETIGEGDDRAALPGTDLIRIRRLSEESTLVETAMAAASDPISVAVQPDAFKPGDILAIADCNRIDLFTAASVSDSAIQPSRPLSQAYRAGSQVMKFRETTYYVGTGETGSQSLRRGGDDAGDLAKGVYAMRAIYGEDVNGDGSVDEYRAASGITDWKRVKSLRVSLSLVSTEQDGGSKAQVPSLKKREQTQIGGVFTDTIALRNRLP